MGSDMGGVKKRKLTRKQEAFVAQYMIDKNSTQAAIRAGFSKRNADVIGPQLLGKSWVREAVDEALSRLNDSAIMSANDVLVEASRLGRFDARKLYRADGSPIPVNELDDDTARCVAAIEMIEVYEGSGKDRVFVGYTKRYKTHDKNSALDKLFKHHGLYDKDNKQKTDPIRDLLDAINGRSAKLTVKPRSVG